LKTKTKDSLDEGVAWLSIRLSAGESQALTLLRATVEIQTLKRTSIKQFISLLIFDALERKRDGKLNLPLQKTVPTIARLAANEQLMIHKTEAEENALKELSVASDGTVLPYGQSDIIREIIKIDVTIIKMNHLLKQFNAQE
jgi:hypothetical protein